MRFRFLILLFSLLIYFDSFSQIKEVEKVESFWDQGIPLCPDDEYISSLVNKIDLTRIKDVKDLTSEEKITCVEIGLAFYARREYDAANWYFTKSINYPIETQISASKEYVYLVKEVMVPTQEPEKIDEKETNEVKKDQNFVKSLPQSYDNLSKDDLKKVAKQIDDKIKMLIAERDSLQRSKSSQQLIDSKQGAIKTLTKEKEIIDLTVVKEVLTGENKDLEIQKSKLKTYLIWAVIGVSVLFLFVLALLQRKTIKNQDAEIMDQLIDIGKKNTYLEHAARIIRHDMHSGINTYIPRGISSLEKRITDEEAKKLKIDVPLKMIKEGLNHTQRVYKSVYEFTNLVKQNIVLDKAEVDAKSLLTEYLKSTSYSSQVFIEDLGTLKVNEILFCNAVDNLIKNGLKYNDKKDKFIKIYTEGNNLIVQDNGKGLSQKDFEKICFAYTNKKNKDIDKEVKGLGLNISLTILKEHGFDLACEKNEIGTKMKIKIKND